MADYKPPDPPESPARPPHHVRVPPEHGHIPHHEPGPKVTGTPAVRREAVMASRQNPPAPPVHPKAFTPWAQLAADAESRLKVEIREALDAYDRATKEAAKVLDVAYSMAAETSSQIRAAAWTEWRKRMDAAARTSDDILEPAVSAYEAVVQAAGNAYDAALAEATKAYKADLSRIEGAKAARDSIRAVS